MKLPVFEENLLKNLLKNLSINESNFLHQKVDGV